MRINWYPGHMTKATRMMQAEAQFADMFILVLDSRAVIASQNPEFFRIAGGKPILYVLNKSDMVERNHLDLWVRHFQKIGANFVLSDSTATKSRNQIIKILKGMAAKKHAKYVALGIKKTCRVIVFGVPNSGKSTLINCLAGSAKTNTGNKPGVTRGKQWVNLGDGLELLDTPGTLPPNINDERASTNLAIIGSINDDIIDKIELAQELSAILNLQNGDEDVLAKTAIERGFLQKGGTPDILRSANYLIDAFRKQRLGKIMLETPDMLTSEED